jgi:hypothetical protein
VSQSEPESSSPRWLPALIAGIVVTILGCTGGAFWFAYRTIGVDHLSDDQIRDGRACTATITAVEDTGSVINDDTVYEFTLRVRPATGAAYDATVRDALNSIEAGRIGAGTTDFPCVIDRDDPTHLEVFWSP